MRCPSKLGNAINFVCPPLLNTVVSAEEYFENFKMWVCPFQVKSGSYFCCCYISLSFLHIATCNFLISVHQLHPRLCFVQLPAHTRPLFKPTLFFLSGTASSAEKPLSSVSFSHPGVAAAVLAVIDTCEILFLLAKK